MLQKMTFDLTMTDPLIRQGHSMLSTVIDPKEYNSEGCVCVD